METSKDFYVTLTSNVDTEGYLNNKTSSFTNILNNTLYLNSNYSVALSEVSFPDKKRINNVIAGHNKITMSNKFHLWFEDKEAEIIVPEFSFHIPPDYYNNIKELVDRINYDYKTVYTGKINNILEIAPNQRVKITDKFAADFQVTKKDQFIKKIQDTIIVKNQALIDLSMLSDKKRVSATPCIQFENRLALQLGFKPNVNVWKEVSATPSVDLGFPQNIFIYCDIIDMQYVGNKLTQILRILPLIPKSNGEFKSLRIIKNECFLRLIKHNISSINIEFRDEFSQLIPFKDGGATTILLHFKKEHEKLFI